jgi:hypothetical protein
MELPGVDDAARFRSLTVAARFLPRHPERRPFYFIPIQRNRRRVA